MALVCRLRVSFHPCVASFLHSLPLLHLILRIKGYAKFILGSIRDNYYLMRYTITYYQEA